MLRLLMLGALCFGCIEFMLYALANFARRGRRKRRVYSPFSCGFHSSRGF